MKKRSISTVLGVFLLLAVAMIAFTAAYLPSARRQLTSLQAEVQLMEGQAELYEAYVHDTSPLEREIQHLQKEIDRIGKDACVDEFHISFAISDAVKLYDVSLLSLSLGNPTSYQESRALPVHLTVRGSTENVLRFIRHFETTAEGSFVSRGATLDFSAERTDASFVLYVCVPEL